MIVECPGCKAVSRLFDWEKATKRACVSRAMRRDYKTILDPRNWAHGVERYYKCPVCERLYRANQLRIQNQSESGHQACAIGGEPLDIRIVQGVTLKSTETQE